MYQSLHLSKKGMIQLIVTGGTFDKTYDHIKGELYFEHTHIPKMLERSRCKLPVHVTPLLLKDSLAFTEEDFLIWAVPSPFRKPFLPMFTSPCKGNIFYGTKSKKTKTWAFLKSCNPAKMELLKPERINFRIRIFVSIKGHL